MKNNLIISIVLIFFVTACAVPTQTPVITPVPVATQKPPKVKVMTAAELLSAYTSGQRDFSDINLKKLELPGADLNGAIFTQANLSGTNLTIANLSGANLTSTNLNGANLSGANLIGANLTEASLIKVNLSGANLTSAILTGAKYKIDTIWPDGFDPVAAGAILKP